MMVPETFEVQTFVLVPYRDKEHMSSCSVDASGIAFHIFLPLIALS